MRLLSIGFSPFPQLHSNLSPSFGECWAVFFSIITFSNIFLGISASCTVACHSLFFSSECNHVFLYILYIPLFTFNVIHLNKKHTFQWKEVSVVSCPVSGHQWKELVSISFALSLQVFIYINEIPPSHLFSRLNTSSRRIVRDE